MSDRFAAGGRPRDEAEAAGAMVEAFYHGLAQRAGTTVDDLVARFGLPEVRAADVAPEGALAQNFVPGRYGFNAVSPSVYPEAGAAVDGLVVRKSIPNRDSIAATFDDGDYTILKGVREIPFAAFRGVEPGVLPTVDARTRALADEIKTNGEINPLIVVLDKEGPYVLEGAHRFDALQLAGKESLPALVVVDHSEGSGIEILPDDAKVTFEAPDPRQMALFQSGQETINTPRFRAWFGGSKVVDENGEPLVVYKTHYADDETPQGFFTDDPKVAAQFGQDFMSMDPNGELGVATTSAYLSLKSPYVIEANGRTAGNIQFDSAELHGGAADEYRAAMENPKYDGVIIRGTSDEGTLYITKLPEQVKSPFNRGTFDPNDPRILFQPSADNGGNGLAGDGVGGAGSPSGMPSSGDKSLSDVARVRAQELRDLLVADSGVVKPFGDLDVVGQTRVLAVMRDLAQDLKVAEIVVPLVPVDVVNVLGREKLTAKALLDKPAMLIDLLPANADNLVARDIAAMNELSAAMTRAATEAAGLPLPGAVGEGRAAGGANVGFHQNTIPDPNKAGNARGAIQFGDTGSIITLLKNADASTALHESSHHFLMMFKSMAEQADAPLEIARDWSVVKDWWGANADRVAADSPADGVTGADVRAVLDTGTTGDRIKDLAINVGLQEQWARGFERYAADGVAPTEGLRAVFAQFKDWLRRVYRALTDLRVDVSPEVKGVFDRLLGGGEEQAAFDLGQPAPRQPIDMTKPAPEPRPDGIEAAAARVGKAEDAKAIADQFGVRENGEFDEQADIDQLKEAGLLDAEDEKILRAADQAIADVSAYEKMLKVAQSCVAGVI